MRSSQFLLVFLVAICMSTIAFSQSGAKGDIDVFEAYVLQTWEQYSEYMNEGNVDDWLALWDANGVQLPPGSPAYEGIEAITKSIRAQHATSDFEQFKIMNKEVEVHGDLGFARGNYSFTATPKKGGDRMQFKGKYLTIFKRQTDGSWRIYRDCFNPNS